MAKEPGLEPKVPTERPDPKAAGRDPGRGAEDRPGFDLGGSVENGSTAGSAVTPGGPRGSASSGATWTGRASGLTDPSGSRSLGNEGDAGSEAGGGGSTAGSGPAAGSGGPT